MGGKINRGELTWVGIDLGWEMTGRNWPWVAIHWAGIDLGWELTGVGNDRVGQIDLIPFARDRTIRPRTIRPWTICPRTIRPTDNSPADNSPNGQFAHKYCYFEKIYGFMD